MTENIENRTTNQTTNPSTLKGEHSMKLESKISKALKNNINTLIQQKNKPTVAPNGEYDLIIRSFELCSKNNDTSVWFKIKFAIDHDVYSDIQFTEVCMIINNNKSAVKIGHEKIAALTVSLSMNSVDDLLSADFNSLVGKKCRAELCIKPAHGRFTEQNKVKTFVKYTDDSGDLIHDYRDTKNADKV